VFFLQEMELRVRPPQVPDPGPLDEDGVALPARQVPVELVAEARKVQAAQVEGLLLEQAT
jgi:hypothetical protein